MLAWAGDSSTHLLPWLRMLSSGLCHTWPPALSFLKVAHKIHHCHSGQWGPEAGTSGHPRRRVFTAHITCQNKNPRKCNFLPPYRSYAISRSECVKIVSPKSQKRYSIFCPQPQGRWYDACWASLNSGDGVYISIISCYSAPIPLPSDWGSCQVWFVPRAKRFPQLVQTTVRGC